MNWNRSLQPWARGGMGNIEMLHRSIAAPPPVMIVAVRHGFNEPALPGWNAIPFAWKRTEALRESAWDEIDAYADGMTEEDGVEETVQRANQQRGTQGLVPRLVQGMVLSDRNGRLYEKQDERVRLLGRVINGMHGKLFELVPLEEQPGAERHFDEARREETDEDPKSGFHAEKSSKGYLPLFPAKEIKRVVRFGEVKGLLLSQVTVPNRLRDEHRLLCRVEIFEITQSRSMECFASALLSETGIAGQLQLLTETMMHKLQLREILPRKTSAGPEEARQPGMLLAGDRVFRLIVVNDPTSERCSVHSGQWKMAEGLKPAESKVESGSEPPRPSTPLKTFIPERFLKPWEFRMSREEALYDMSAQTRNHSFLDRFRSWRRNGEELKKWQALLIGKGLDEQLWGIRPPVNAFYHSEIREWVQRTLQHAGYDVGVMLAEWEVYWRRKGS